MSPADPRQTVKFQLHSHYLAVLFLLVPLSASADRLLVAECKVRQPDDYFGGATHFAIAFNVDSSEETIWLARADKFELFAQEGPEGPFEVNGGAWSIALASDVRRSLRLLAFHFVESEPIPPFLDAAAELAECGFEYARLREYDSH